MTATIHQLRPYAPIAIPADTIRADCERLMRRLVRDGRTPERQNARCGCWLIFWTTSLCGLKKHDPRRSLVPL
jgi:hypothetical protein